MVKSYLTGNNPVDRLLQLPKKVLPLLSIEGCEKVTLHRVEGMPFLLVRRSPVASPQGKVNDSLFPLEFVSSLSYLVASPPSSVVELEVQAPPGPNADSVTSFAVN
jgi:hypothetical protein